MRQLGLYTYPSHGRARTHTHTHKHASEKLGAADKSKRSAHLKLKRDIRFLRHVQEDDDTQNHNEISELLRIGHTLDDVVDAGYTEEEFIAEGLGNEFTENRQHRWANHMRTVLVLTQALTLTVTLPDSDP